MTAPQIGLRDTSAVVLLERLRPLDLPAEPVISAVTLAELSVGPLVVDDPVERATRQVRLQEVESAFDALPFDAAAARAFGRVTADLRRGGRSNGVTGRRRRGGLVVGERLDREIVRCWP